MAHEAVAVRVGRVQPAVLEPERVGSGDGTRAGHRLARRGIGLLLVRDRHVAAGEALLAPAARKAATSSGRTGRFV